MHNTLWSQGGRGADYKNSEFSAGQQGSFSPGPEVYGGQCRQFSGLAFQIGIVMYIMIYLGGWIQDKWDISSKWPVLVTSSIGLVLVILIITKQGNRS